MIITWVFFYVWLLLTKIGKNRGNMRFTQIESIIKDLQYLYIYFLLSIFYHKLFIKQLASFETNYY